MDQRQRNLRIVELALEMMELPENATLAQMVSTSEALYDRVWRWFNSDNIEAHKQMGDILNVGEQLLKDVGEAIKSAPHNVGPGIVHAVDLSAQHDPTPVTELPVEPGKSWSRGPAEKGIKWGTGWVSPTNTKMPQGFSERRSSGWYVKGHQAEIMRLFVGEHGRVHASFNTIVKKVKIPNGPSQKPHTPIHSLIRRGLLYEVSRHVYAMTPRGKVWCEWMGYTPAGNPNIIETVAE